uniref:Uncharacterized protein n=1 Tax=Oryza brachyantha TaxID=4533 RepID=J3NDQ5_ORYBR
MARKAVGVEVELGAIEEELGLYSRESVETLAISLLDRAMSYLYEIDSKLKWPHTRVFFRNAREICDGLRTDLTNWPRPTPCGCGYEEILRLRAGVEQFEDLIEEIVPEKRGRNRNPTFSFKILKAKTANRSGNPGSRCARLGVQMLESGLLQLRGYFPVVGQAVLDDVARRPSRTAPDRDQDVIGREREKEQIVQWLIKRPSSESSEIVDAGHC